MRASNTELNLILYLPLLDLLEASLPTQSSGFEVLNRQGRAAMLIDWVNFLNEISNSCFPYIALVLPETSRTGTTADRDPSQFLAYAKTILHGRVMYYTSC